MFLFVKVRIFLKSKTTKVLTLKIVIPQTTYVQLYVKRNSKSSSEHDHAICDDFTRSLNILESTSKNML